MISQLYRGLWPVRLSPSGSAGDARAFLFDCELVRHAQSKMRRLLRSVYEKADQAVMARLEVRREKGMFPLLDPDQSSDRFSRWGA